MKLAIYAAKQFGLEHNLDLGSQMLWPSSAVTNATRLIGTN